MLMAVSAQTITLSYFFFKLLTLVCDAFFMPFHQFVKHAFKPFHIQREVKIPHCSFDFFLRIKFLSSQASLQKWKIGKIK
jgi:hypothetical protein